MWKDEVWAKSDGSPLVQHLSDVCRQASEFATAYEPWWPLADEADVRRIIAYSALLHDFGKVHPRFQAALQGGPRFGNRHEILSLGFLEWLEIPECEFMWVAAAIATHHKGWQTLRDRFAGAEEGTDLCTLCRDVPEGSVQLLYDFLRNTNERLSELGWAGVTPYTLRPYSIPDFQKVIPAVLQRVGAYLGSLDGKRLLRGPVRRVAKDWGPAVAAIQTRGWLLSADHLASFRPRAIVRAMAKRTDVESRFAGITWREHQKALANHEGSALLIAPTGSGKTEAGLLWAARQAECGAHGRVCLILPYQASLNAMQKRLVERFAPEASATPQLWNDHAALVHGRASRAMYEAFLRHDHAPAEAERKARESNELARLFASPVTLGTIFSIVRLLFATRGAERLMATMSGARIVVDEIHAYQPDVTAMALAVLAFLQQHLRARVLFLSATVPAHLEAVLRKTMGVKRVPETPPWGEKKRHRITVWDTDALSQTALQGVLAASRRGSVLVVVNQVKRAVELRRRLRPHVETRLLHSRFHYADRADIERGLTPKAGVVLVATQAVEVSLDVDFDFCFSELAPMESLAQRFGRCNRRGWQPVPATVVVFGRFPEGQNAHRPYEKDHMKRVLDVLREYAGVDGRDLGDGDVHELLNASYPGELQQKLEQAVVEQAAKFTRLFLDCWKPYGLLDSQECRDLERQWEELFDGEEVLPASLLAKAREAESPFARKRFLVPVAAHQMARYRPREDEELGCYVMDREYGEDGLDL